MYWLGYSLDCPVFGARQWQENVASPKPTRPPVLFFGGGGGSGKSVRLTTGFHLVPRFRMGGAIPVRPPGCMISWIVKVKWSRYRPGVAQRVGRGIVLLFHDRGTRKWWVVSSTPRPHFTPRKDSVTIYRRLGGPQGRSGRAENLVPTEIQSRTVQPLVSRYTDWATRPILMGCRGTNSLYWDIKIKAFFQKLCVQTCGFQPCCRKPKYI